MELVLEQVAKSYLKKGGRHSSGLESQTMTIRSGEQHLLYGSSGSGKTTLLHLMCGMLSPTEGKIIIDGREIQKLSGRALAKVRREYFGYIMQDAALLDSLTVYQNIMLSKLMGNSSPKSVNEEYMKRFQLEKVKDSYPAELSGGEYRRCAVLRAIALKPQILLADEPTSNLDDVNAMVIINELDRLRKQNVAVVIATHDPRFLERESSVHHIG